MKQLPLLSLNHVKVIQKLGVPSVDLRLSSAARLSGLEDLRRTLF